MLYVSFLHVNNAKIGNVTIAKLTFNTFRFLSVAQRAHQYSSEKQDGDRSTIK